MHDSKWTGFRRPRPRAVHTRSGHPQFCRRPGTVCPPSGGLGAVSTARAPAARPLVVSTDEELLDDLLRLLAAAGAEPELATAGPALRRAHRDAPLVLLGADALTGAAVRALPRRPGVVVVSGRPLPATGWAAAVEVGAERVAVLPEDEAWLLARSAAAAQVPAERGWLVAVGGSCGGAGASTVAAAVALAAAPGVLLVDADPWGARPRSPAGRRARRGAALAGARRAARAGGRRRAGGRPARGRWRARARRVPVGARAGARRGAGGRDRGGARGRPAGRGGPAALRAPGRRRRARRGRPRGPGRPGPPAGRHRRPAAGAGPGIGLVGGPPRRPSGGRRPLPGRGRRRRGPAGPGRPAARPQCRAARGTRRAARRLAAFPAGIRSPGASSTASRRGRRGERARPPRPGPRPPRPGAGAALPGGGGGARPRGGRPAR